MIHAARRDIDLTVICINNQTYGMTGGQMAPTTPKGDKTLTSRYGSAYYPINLQGLITSNPHHFYARGSAFRINHLQKCLRQAIAWPGFSFVDAISYCIENYGRRQGFSGPFAMLDKIRESYKINPKPEGLLQPNELGVVSHDD